MERDGLSSFAGIAPTTDTGRKVLAASVLFGGLYLAASFGFKPAYNLAWLAFLGLALTYVSGAMR